MSDETTTLPQEVLAANGKLDPRKAFFEAAAKELRPLQMVRLRLAMALRPVKAQAAIDMVEMRLQAEGILSEDGDVQAAVDWNQILAIILELLPVILKLFGL
jgi:hypothetical protein